MMRGSFAGATRMAMGTVALACVLGLSGCSLNPFSSLTTPTLAELEQQEVSAAVSDDALVASGTLTVALDTSDAPQAMKNADGTLTGYAVDTARALACRMGLKVSFVESSSAASALNDHKADIFIGDIDNMGSGLTSVGTFLMDAPSVFGKSGDGAAQNVSTDMLGSANLGVQNASASQEALTKLGITGTQKTYANINECFEALTSGEVDYVVCDSTAGGYLARMYDGIAYVGALQTPTTLGIAALSASSALTDAVSNALDGITADGTLEAVHSVWYGTMPFDLTKKVVSGAGVSTQSASSGTSSSASSASASDQQTTITDDDINKLSD